MKIRPSYIAGHRLKDSQRIHRFSWLTRYDTSQKLWTKGETSGNRLRVISAATDCDRDTLLLPYHHIGTEKYRRLGLDYRLRETTQPAAAEMARMARAVVGGSV